ncbi:MAG: MarR family winged helix-turn-helix transcriptional regulator [Negativicutes bacterium]|nr:MarR family winged helix-turn-helix transcriptional regulator [Negativicutes bacterium]
MERAVLAGARRCACGNVRRTTRALTQFYDQQLKSSGLRVTQFSLLLNISLHEGITVGELARLLLMDQTTVTRDLTALKKAGYIEATRQDRDTRKKNLILSPAGSEVLAAAMPLWEKAQACVEDGLGRERYRELLRMLSEVAALTR